MALIDRITKISGRDDALIIPGMGMGVDAMPKVQPMMEAGVSGLLRTKGVGK